MVRWSTLWLKYLWLMYTFAFSRLFSMSSSMFSLAYIFSTLGNICVCVFKHNALAGEKKGRLWERRAEEKWVWLQRRETRVECISSGLWCVKLSVCSYLFKMSGMTFNTHRHPGSLSLTLSLPDTWMKEHSNRQAHTQTWVQKQVNTHTHTLTLSNMSINGKSHN